MIDAQEVERGGRGKGSKTPKKKKKIIKRSNQKTVK